jgi:hypothetical protein
VATSTRFDLAIAASENDDLHLLDAPVVLVPHGLGYQKYYPGSRVIAGMNPERLLHKGNPVPAAIVVSHPDQRSQLLASCPPVAARAVVAGDPCLDRILASRHLAHRYRRAFGAADRRLVFLASTWGPDSLFGTDPRLPERLLAELPVDECQVAISLHAGVWAHSPWQVRAWLTRARESGLRILPVHDGWRAAVLAADVAVSDRGSLSLYAAAADTPLLLTGGSGDTTVAGSPMAALAEEAARLDDTGDLRAQLETAIHGHVPGRYEPIVKQAVEHPGQSAPILRELLYRLLRLPEPLWRPEFDPVPTPEPESAPVRAFLAGGDPAGDAVTIHRFPGRPDRPDLGYQHIAVDFENARLSEVDAATILYLPWDTDFRVRAELVLRQWPHARIAAAVSGPRRCTLLTRDGRTVTFILSAPADPLLAASLAYVTLTRSGHLPEHDRIRIGHRVIDVAAAPVRPDTGTPLGD